ncbi:MAG: hypothetical protein SF051_11040 [Elusimicrobiota bacterium]|nr:hypothetical protein [Elusimicrobiota bacterium]
MSALLLLAAWCGVASVQAAPNEEPDLVKNPVLKLVLVNKEDRQAYEEFAELDVGRVAAVAHAIGAGPLPVERAHFTLLNLNPHYSPWDRFVSLGAIPRRGGVGVGYRAVSIHELGHAMLNGYFTARSGEEMLYTPSNWRLLAPLDEFFADSLAVLLLADADAITGALAPASAMPRGSRAAAQRRVELARRDSDDKLAAVCDASDPEAHYWFPMSRRVLWQEVFVGKYGRSQDAVPKIIKALMEQVHAEWLKQMSERDARERAQFARLSQAPRSGLVMGPPPSPRPAVGSELLNVPQGFDGMVEELTDDRLRTALRKRFGLPNP